MHTFLRRSIVLGGLLILILPLLAACGGGGDNDDDSVDPSATSIATEAESTATDAPDPGAPTETEAESESTEIEEDAKATAEAAEPSPSPTSEPTPTVPPASVEDPTAGFVYGWNVSTRGDDTGGEHNDMTVDAVIESGFSWVRFQIEWSSFEPNPDAWAPLPTDRVVEAFSDAGIGILIAVTDAPEWAIDPTGEHFLTDYAEFEQLMAFLAQRYSGRVQAWEIWNEQNLAALVGGTVRPEEYLELLKAGYTGVKSGDPNALVAFGGLTPTGVNDPSIAVDDLVYLDQMYQLANGEVVNYFDILAVHVNGTNNPPDTMWPDNPGPGDWSDHESFYFRRTEQLYEVLLRNGDSAKPIWITEFGWTTANPVPGYEYGADNSEQDVADYVTRSIEIARDEWSFVTGVFVWNLNWSTLVGEDDEKYYWSALNSDWSPRPLYDAVTGFEK